MIADLAKKYNVLVISDEVYEWLVYEPSKHIRIGNVTIFLMKLNTQLCLYYKYTGKKNYKYFL